MKILTCLFFISLNLLWVHKSTAQTTVNIAQGTAVGITGNAQFIFGGGSLNNAGSMTVNSSTLTINGATAITNTGNLEIYSLNFNHPNAVSSLNSDFKINNLIALRAGTLNGTGRPVLQNNASFINNGEMNSTVSGLKTFASAVSGSTTYNSSLSLNISGSSVVYQWQSSPNSVTWNDIPAATAATYTATVNMTTYYRAKLTANNNAYLQYSSPVELGFTTLPVKLVSYLAKVENNRVRLDWNTASEDKNLGFDIEKSTDGKTFTNLKFIPTKGNTGKSYVIYDTMPSNGVSYYRLSQRDLDGTVTLLGIRSINFSLGATEKLFAYPNPALSTINVWSPANKKAFIYSLQGQLLKNLNLETGNTTLNISDMSPGIYVLKTADGETTKIVKQ